MKKSYKRYNVGHKYKRYKKYHYIYKMTNIITGHYYIGAHSTYKINDDYYGSGVFIKKAIKHYGVKNFKKEILLFCKDQSDKWKKERKIVNKEVVLDPNCYNIITGGRNKSKNTFKCNARIKNFKELFDE